MESLSPFGLGIWYMNVVISVLIVLLFVLKFFHVSPFYKFYDSMIETAVIVPILSVIYVICTLILVPSNINTFWTIFGMMIPTLYDICLVVFLFILGLLGAYQGLENLHKKIVDKKVNR